MIQNDEIMKMAKVLAWVQIDPDTGIDAVWSCLRETTKDHYVRKASMVLEKMGGQPAK